MIVQGLWLPNTAGSADAAANWRDVYAEHAVPFAKSTHSRGTESVMRLFVLASLVSLTGKITLCPDAAFAKPADEREFIKTC